MARKPKAPPKFKLSSVQMISLSGLKARGWNERLIDDVLGEPHVLTKNPHYRCAAPMRLYYRAHVEAQEQLPTVQAAIEKTLNRSNAIKRANLIRREAEEAEARRLAEIREAERKRLEEIQALQEAEVLSRLWAWPISVDKLDRWQLEEKALAWHTRWYRNYRGCHINGVPRDILNQFALEYVELHLLKMQQNKVQLSRKAGKEFAKAIGVQIYACIAAVYPHLADLCTKISVTEFGRALKPAKSN